MSARKVRQRERFKSLILANAAEIARLKACVQVIYEHRNESDESLQAWKAAGEELHERYDALAFPGGYDGALQRIKSGDGDTIEAALCFIEVRPYFFRSGYIFDELLRKIKRATLSKDQAERLETVIRKRAEWRKR